MQVRATSHHPSFPQLESPWAAVLRFVQAANWPSLPSAKRQPRLPPARARDEPRQQERFWQGFRALRKNLYSSPEALTEKRIARMATRREALSLGSIREVWEMQTGTEGMAPAPLDTLGKFTDLDLRLTVDSPALLQWLPLIVELDRKNVVQITYVVSAENPEQIAPGLEAVRDLSEQGLWVQLVIRPDNRTSVETLEVLFEKARSAGACDVLLVGPRSNERETENRHLRMRWGFPRSPSSRG